MDLRSASLDLQNTLVLVSERKKPTSIELTTVGTVRCPTKFLVSRSRSCTMAMRMPAVWTTVIRVKLIVFTIFPFPAFFLDQKNILTRTERKNWVS